MAIAVQEAQSDADLSLCLKIRREVFVDEQGVSIEREVDGADPESRHFLACFKDKPVATVRLRQHPDRFDIERLAVRKGYRGLGLGRALMARLEAEAKAQGVRCLRLSAQAEAISYYKRLGFKAQGPVYVDADMPHRRMEKCL